MNDENLKYEYLKLLKRMSDSLVLIQIMLGVLLGMSIGWLLFH